MEGKIINNKYTIKRINNHELNIGFEIKDDVMVKFCSIDNSRVLWKELISKWNELTGDTLNETEDSLDDVLIGHSIYTFNTYMESDNVLNLESLEADQYLLLNTCKILNNSKEFKNKLFNFKYFDNIPKYSKEEEDEKFRNTDTSISLNKLNKEIEKYDITLSVEEKQRDYLEEILDMNSNTKGIKSWGI